MRNDVPQCAAQIIPQTQVSYLRHGDVRGGDLLVAGVLNVDADADVFARDERSPVELQRAGHEPALTGTPARLGLGVHPNTLLHTARVHSRHIFRTRSSTRDGKEPSFIGFGSGSSRKCYVHLSYNS